MAVSLKYYIRIPKVLNELLASSTSDAQSTKNCTMDTEKVNCVNHQECKHDIFIICILTKLNFNNVNTYSANC